MSDIYLVKVDYTLSLGEMVQIGCYDQVVGDGMEINQPSRVERHRGQAEIKMGLISTECRMDLDEIHSLVWKSHVRMATVAELLAFGATYKEVQKSSAIIALGSSCDCGEYLVDVASLGSGDERSVYTGRCGRSFHPVRIAVVHD